MEDKFLYDKKIGWAKLQAKKEGEYGPYEIWSFKVEDDDRYFSIIPGGSAKHKPFTGAKVEMCKYYIEQKGEYTNYKVRELFLSEDTQKPSQTRSDAPQSTFSQKEGNGIGPMTMWGKYIADIVSSCVTMGLSGEALDSVAKEAIETYVDCLVVFERNYSNVNYAEPSQPDTTA